MKRGFILGIIILILVISVFSVSVMAKKDKASDSGAGPTGTASSGSSGNNGNGGNSNKNSEVSGTDNSGSSSGGQLAEIDDSGTESEDSPIESETSTSNGNSGSTNSGSGVSKETSTQVFLNNEGEEIEVTVRIETKERNGETYQKIKVRGYEAISESEVESEGGKLKFKLSNGNNQEIKVMPDSASETAIEKLESKKNLSVRLKETGEGNNLSVVYEAKDNQTVKFLGLFKVRTQLTAVISAENGEILRLEKPWWHFLAFGEGAVDCNENDLDLCDDETECDEAGLIWFEGSCVSGCPEDAQVCEDNETTVSRNPDLNCEFDACPVIISEDPCDGADLDEDGDVDLDDYSLFKELFGCEGSYECSLADLDNDGDVDLDDYMRFNNNFGESGCN